ncbi:MAG: glycerol-3-phosphate 1-O-acyltransferase PlsY [Eubacteriales bacterium]|nr:glycerol-3-phosphate 1-O-acyltransferase PlsY [Eubacteriales bacterium]
MNYYYILLCILIGYLFGSIPIGYLYSLSKGKNIFEEGSKSPGSTNVGRVFGKKAGNLVFVLDILKTVFGIIFAIIIFMKIININVYTDYSRAMIIMYTGLGCIIGHNYPFTTKFKGGKGIACTCAVILCFCWWLALILYCIHILIKKISNYVSIASIVAVVLVFVSSLIMIILYVPPYNFEKSYNLLPATFLMMCLGIFTHRANIKRLILGKENKYR